MDGRSRVFEGTPPAELELDGEHYRRVSNPEYWLYEHSSHA